MRLPLQVLALALTGLLLSCGSGRAGASYLYAEGPGEPRLLDSEIRMETARHIRGGPGPDVRSVTCTAGKIVAFYRSPTLREEGSAEVPFDDYARLWSEVMDRAGWSAEAEAADPQGGLYHYIRFRLATRVGETSAQDRSAFLGMGTANIRERLELANEVTKLVAKFVKPGPLAPESADPSGEERE